MVVYIFGDTNKSLIFKKIFAQQCISFKDNIANIREINIIYDII